jgi:hypothetical protein
MLATHAPVGGALSVVSGKAARSEAACAASFSGVGAHAVEAQRLSAEARPASLINGMDALLLGRCDGRAYGAFALPVFAEVINKFSRISPNVAGDPSAANNRYKIGVACRRECG